MRKVESSLCRVIIEETICHGDCHPVFKHSFAQTIINKVCFSSIILACKKTFMRRTIIIEVLMLLVDVAQWSLKECNPFSSSLSAFGADLYICHIFVFKIIFQPLTCFGMTADCFWFKKM